jgi:hypothetical protein
MGTAKQNNIDNDRRKQLASLKVDRAVGAILDKLAAVGQDQNTLVLYTATTATVGRPLPSPEALPLRRVSAWRRVVCIRRSRRSCASTTASA